MNLNLNKNVNAITPNKINLNQTQKDSSNNHKLNADEIDLKIYEEIEKLDTNFLYSKDLFSNFINYNIDLNHINNNDNNTPISKILEDFKEDKEDLNDYILESNLKLKEIQNKLLTDKKAKPLSRYFILDKVIGNYFDSLEKVDFTDKNTLKKQNILLFKSTYEKNYLQLELDEFKNQIDTFEHTLKRKNLSQLERIIYNEFQDSVLEEEKYLDFSNKKSEKFRYETSNTYSQNKQSLDSFAKLENVFETSTEKKLLQRTSFLYENYLKDNNVIIEEESNFNLNTFSLNFKSNNLYTNIEFHEDNYQNEGSQLDLEVKETVYKFMENLRK